LILLRILIFGRASTADWADQMHYVYVDGAFEPVPHLFNQIYVLLSRRGQWVFPVCYCLLTSSSQSMYERMFRLLLQCWHNFAPQIACLDFDQQMVGAVNALFPACNVHFSFKHLVRKMKQQLAERELLQLYKTDAVFAEKARMITSLAFIPVEDLIVALAILATQLPSQLMPVFNWFLANYTGRPRFNGTLTEPLFLLHFWSVYQRVLDGEDGLNAAAAPFRRLQCAFGVAAPSIWRFINKLRREQQTVDAGYAKFLAGEKPPPKAKKYRDADARTLQLVQRYVVVSHANLPIDHIVNAHQNHITEFLTCISRNYDL